jgi:hypothetical protein
MVQIIIKFNIYKHLTCFIENTLNCLYFSLVNALFHLEKCFNYAFNNSCIKLQFNVKDLFNSFSFPIIHLIYIM